MKIGMIKSRVVITNESGTFKVHRLKERQQYDLPTSVAMPLIKDHVAYNAEDEK